MSSKTIRDLDAPEERTTTRSNRVLFIGIALAVVAGGGAALLKNVARPDPSSGNVVIPVESDAPPDGAALRARLLDELVADARITPDPTELPAFRSFVLPCRRGGPVCDEVFARLERDDVPWNLTVAFARELPAHLDARVDGLLLPAFGGDDEARVVEALDVLRARKRVTVGSSTRCGCGFGSLKSGADGWLLAFPAAPEGRLSWAPEQTPKGWVLNVRSDPEGQALLRQRLPADELSPVYPDRTSPPAGDRAPVLPPRPDGR